MPYRYVKTPLPDDLAERAFGHPLIKAPEIDVHVDGMDSLLSVIDEAWTDLGFALIVGVDVTLGEAA